MRTIKTIVILCAVFMAPFFVHAVSFRDILTQSFNPIFSALTGVLVTIGLLYFLYGVTKYVANQGDEQGRTEARQMMINGIIALFVMVSVWGLVQVLVDTFRVGGSTAPTKPSIVNF